ncbi:LuxR C-terminal-related transcriptional regulator [Streptomyces cylindrosporus]|uniref:LuxR C-terminal-related transcriptional regulator n=1 Tax=Streptomyces cylindrosporus TaxID=2927583 RepID=A0ABS9YNL1_9ACTN|nr:LuxR C-terminal-related transcriptional regulator [Streptomyces cylindrosporus]MCI3278807.1 LuxR C-terminal-related transcriptional regulator [Streptomyces cylindrosporus]
MPAVLGSERRETALRPAEARRVSVLHGRLRALGEDESGADTVVATCLVWVADTLVDIAAAVGDARSAGVLVDEASAVLAAVPRDGRGRQGPVTPAEALTEREHAVLVRLQEDVPLRQIGTELFISHNTVKSHARAVYRKLGVSSRTEALHRARQLRLL